VKGFCNDTSQVLIDLDSNSGSLESDISQENINTGSINQSSGTQSLSATDVLIWDGYVPQWENIEVTDETKTLSWTLLQELQESEQEDTGNDSMSDAETTDTNPTTGETQDTWILWVCSNNFVGPIAFGWDNSSTQVRYLENFLVLQWYTASQNWNYDTVDFESVKQFQLDYRSDVLDPWGIDAPTGYVFTTTILKMKDLACQ